jgi:integrase/recombinase XerD
MTDTLAVWAERYLDHLAVERGLSPNTLAAYRRDLRRYVAFCTKRDVLVPGDVDEPTIRSFVASISASTWGEDERAYSARPSRARSRPCGRSIGSCSVKARVARSRRRRSAAEAPAFVAAPAPVDEVSRLLEAPDTATLVGLRDRAILEVLYGRDCGSRSWSGSTSTTWTWRRAPSGSSAREGAEVPWARSVAKR